MSNKIIIAIDGHSSTGKSTLARRLARELQYLYVDTGAMYRAVTLYGLRTGAIAGNTPNRGKIIDAIGQINLSFRHNPATGENEMHLNGENVEVEIRGMEVSNCVSPVSAIPEVRKKLVHLQQVMGRDGGLVMDGRDIGTVVFPQAALKIFMTASPEVRAKRRYDELRTMGKETTLEEVLRNVIERDEQDSTRADSPLKLADDALLMDNTNLTPDEQFVLAMKWVAKRTNAGK